MDKRGQIYLIAALAIIVLIIAVFSIVALSQSSPDIKTKAETLSEQLDTELSYFLSYAASQDDYDWGNFTSNFSLYAGNDVDILYMHLKLRDGGIVSGTQAIYTYVDGVKVSPPPGWAIDPASYNPGPSTITFSATYRGVQKTFTFREGQNFYYIIIQDIGEERHVFSNAA